MRKLLTPLRGTGVSNFMEDLLLTTRTWQEHVILLRKVLERLSQSGLTVQPSKCHIGFQRLTFLGSRLSADTLTYDSTKVDQLRNTARSATETEVRYFVYDWQFDWLDMEEGPDDGYWDIRLGESVSDVLE
ncbi:hypothetical protein ACJMK2_015649 [Sinanodonta woodiana]|uniref:Reverse transcriptase domain-containing protein n=1 Tax=Sinanodonta woodiana TaxID=1069815 RepID=A0ABD3UR24_SINWO